jgi:hypothetical protein
VRRENWIAFGLVVIVVGLLFLAFSNGTISVDNYVAAGSLDNSINYAAGRPPQVNVSGNFEVNQHFFFNFSKGRFWGVSYDQNYGGLEPTITDFAPGTSLPPHKIVTFDIYTPSGDVIETEIYVVEGTDPFAVVYLNQSTDFVPLGSGNLTLVNVGLEGTIRNNGTYTVKASYVFPPVYRDANDTYDINTDPPLLMNLWNIDSVETKPYFVPFISVGTILLLSGAGTSVLGGKSRGRPNRHLKKKNK